MRRNIVSLLAGIGIGFVYFIFVHPKVVGTPYRLLLERESVLAFAFRGLPLLAAIIIVYVTSMRPRSRHEALVLALLAAGACLLPIPLGQYALEAPEIFAMPRGSKAMLADEAIALFTLLFATIAVSVLAAVVSAPLRGLVQKFRKELRRI